MQDLVQVKSGEMTTKLREIVSRSSQHVADCQVGSTDLFCMSSVQLCYSAWSGTANTCLYRVSVCQSGILNGVSNTLFWKERHQQFHQQPKCLQREGNHAETFIVLIDVLWFPKIINLLLEVKGDLYFCLLPENILSISACFPYGTWFLTLRRTKNEGRIILELKLILMLIPFQLCQARGFVCELCPSQEVIFPWQLGRVTRCSTCGACFHIACWSPSPCPRCTRLSARRQSHVSDSDADIKAAWPWLIHRSIYSHQSCAC